MSYIGVGGAGDMSLRNADSAKRVLNSTFLVQEYVEGGNLRKQVLEQVHGLLSLAAGHHMKITLNSMPSLYHSWHVSSLAKKRCRVLLLPVYHWQHKAYVTCVQL